MAFQQQFETSNGAIQYLLEFCPGFRFVPTDAELITNYLVPKIQNLGQPHIQLIHDRSIYSDNPDNLVVEHLPQEEEKERRWYFFSPKVDKKVLENRKAGDGYWRATAKKRTVTNKNNEELGTKRTFAYCKGVTPKGVKSNWIMHEYSLKGEASGHKLVLCRIYKKEAANNNMAGKDQDTNDVNQLIDQTLDPENGVSKDTNDGITSAPLPDLNELPNPDDDEETTTMVTTSSVGRAGFTYYITLGDTRICSTFAQDHSNIKDWISQIEKRCGNKKQQPLVVGFWAEQSLYYIDRKHDFQVKDDKNNHKTAPYELLVLCVGDQCLLWELHIEYARWHTPREGYVLEMPKALKDFLRSSQIIVVGLGIDAMVKKLESETDLLIRKHMELTDLVQQKMGLTQGEFAENSLEGLAKLLMGLNMEVVKPESMTWREPGYSSSLSDKLVQYGSIHAFLVAEMADQVMRE